MTAASSLKRFAILIATASLVLGACTPDTDGGSGPAVVQQQPVTTTTGFDFIQLGSFSVGDSPTNAVFSGGVATGGAWVIRDGDTGVVTFSSPTRDTSLTIEGLTPVVSAALFAKAGLPRRLSKTTCGVTDQGNDNSEALGQNMFMRGGFNDWGNPSPTDEFLFVNFGDGIYQAEFEMVAGEYNYKVGSAGWEVERATSPDDVLEVGDTQPLVDPGPGGPEGVLIVPEDGCFNFSIDFSDVENATMTMTQVDLGGGGPPGGGKEECGLADQGNDNAEAFGNEMFMRGGFNDWGNPSPTSEFLFINFGGGIYQSEFEMTAGEYNYKVGSAGWEVERATVPDDVLEPGDTQALVDPGPGGPEGVLNVPTDGCYNFTADWNDIEAASITMTEVELGGGGPIDPGLPATTDVTAINTDGSPEEVLIEGAGPTTVSFERGGRDSPVRTIEIFAGNGDVAVTDMSWVANPADFPTLTTATVSYHRADGNYADTFIVVGGESYACVPDGGFGCSADVPAPAGGILTFTVTQGGVPDPTGTFLAPVFEDPADGNNIYAFSGNPEAINDGTEAAVPGSDEIILYYDREDGDYTGWNMHLFPIEPSGASWTIFDGAEECTVEGTDAIGTYFRITLPPNPCYDNNPEPADAFPDNLGLVIHLGSAKAPDGDISIRVAVDGNILFVSDSSPDISSAPPSEGASLSGRAAHWVDTGTLLWNAGGDVTTVELLWSADASIAVRGGVISGNYESVELTPGTNPQPANQLHLSGYDAYAMPASVTGNAKEIARYQLVALGRDGFGIPVTATYVQTPGLLDDLYAAAATQVELGVSWSGATPTIRVWAPTAYPDTGVTLNLYSAPGQLVDQVAMTLDAASGVWSATGDATWDRMYYDFTLEVYTYAESDLVTNTVTDPYSISLSANSAHSQIVNLDDLDLQPPGWDALVLPAYGEPEDIAVYELHMRDYSVSDATVPEADRGKYTAFALDNTDGHAHLTGLAGAGLTHLHLLPSFDIATIEEIRANRVELDDLVDDLCAANPAAAGL
ncbi:MAG: pullulanase-associated domain-containing protein, partial [Gammaproteobacteria bacterium]